jgi:hypothetical protein
MAVRVGGVAHAPEGPADHLLAQQLGAEGANTEHVRDGVGVPALGQHGNADDATDVFAELAGLADGVHHFAEQVLVGKVLGVAAGKAGAIIGLELVNFTRSDLLEVVAHRLAGFELPAVHQDSVRAVEPTAIAVVIAENGQLSRLNDYLFADLLFPTGNEFKNEFGDVGVVADNYEDRRRSIRASR